MVLPLSPSFLMTHMLTIFRAPEGFAKVIHYPFFLFLVVAKAFSMLLEKGFQGGLLEGFEIGQNSIIVSHLQFANDTLVLCKGSKKQLKFLSCVIRWFEAVLCLKVNLSKSCMYEVGQVGNLKSLVSVLGCQVGNLPFYYLGLPLGAPYKSKHVCNQVIERVHRWLAGWKGLYLSKGSRITLIKLVFTNLPTYFLSLFVIPFLVANMIKKYQRDFLWGKNREGKGLHLIAWEEVCKPKMSGELGIKRIKDVN